MKIKNLASKRYIALLTLLISFSFTNTTEAWSCGSALVDSRDSQSYATVLIGAQCWMQQNLNVGTMILKGVTQGTSSSNIQKFCFNDNESNCSTGGGLYQWNQAMCGSTTAGAQGICPVGWHIPTHDEFTTLERSVCTSGTCDTDFPYDTTTISGRGTNEGTTLKDMTGLFRALLPGYIRNNSSFFASFAYFHSSSLIGNSVWHRSTTGAATTISRNSSSIITSGFSIRCLADTKTLTYTPDSNGTITGSSTQTVVYGSDGTQVTAVPNTGYQFINWSDNSTTNPRTDTNITDNINITASFSIIPIQEEKKRSTTSLKTRINNLNKMGKTDKVLELQKQYNVPTTTNTTNKTSNTKKDNTKPSTNNSTPSSNSTRDLDLNTTGDDVKSLQQLLISKGYNIPAGTTGYFGKQTKQALIQFQQANNITPAIGYYGPKTKAFIKTILEQ